MEKGLPAKLFDFFFTSLCVLICGIVQEVLFSDCFFAQEFADFC